MLNVAGPGSAGIGLGCAVTKPILVRISGMNTAESRLLRGRRARHRLIAPFVALLLALPLAACGDEESSSTTTAGSGTTAAEPSPPAGGSATTSTDVAPGSGEEPKLPDNDDFTAVTCTAPPRETFDATAVVGEPLGSATKQARAAGCDVRVVIEDGKPLATTSDYRPDRINVVVTDDTVKRIDGLY